MEAGQKRTLTDRYYDGFGNFRHPIATCLENLSGPAKSELTSVFILNSQLFKVSNS